jgi:hypothetical protein
VADVFFASDEYRQDLVQSYYERFLHRAAENAGLTVWVTALRNGLRDENVVAQIISSPEYFGRL